MPSLPTSVVLLFFLKFKASYFLASKLPFYCTRMSYGALILRYNTTLYSFLSICVTTGVAIALHSSVAYAGDPTYAGWLPSHFQHFRTPYFRATPPCFCCIGSRAIDTGTDCLSGKMWRQSPHCVPKGSDCVGRYQGLPSRSTDVVPEGELPVEVNSQPFQWLALLGWADMEPRELDCCRGDLLTKMSVSRIVMFVWMP